jgi:peptidoglycan/xylan/chitin deacetylase (PgdA/CDA1 family)
MKLSKSVINILYAVCFLLALGAIFKQAFAYRGLVLRAAEFDTAKKVALTFDDGPHPIYTPRLLDELKKRDIKATFFVTGENVENNREIVQRMYSEGHLIGNHTYSHIQLTSYNREEFCSEITRTNEVIYDITGMQVNYVRPPYGAWDKALETRLNMFPVLWNVDTLDWCSKSPIEIARRALSDVEEYDIILMHDYYSTSVEAATIIIDELTQRGYKFVTVDEVLFE